MIVLQIPASLSGTDHETAMRNSAVILLQFFFTDKMNRCVIICKIVWHSLNGFFYFCCISTFFQNHKTLSGMFLSGSKIRIFSISHCLQRRLYRYGILLAIFYALYTTDRIGMSLADTFAPECIILSFWKNCICGSVKTYPDPSLQK